MLTSRAKPWKFLVAEILLSVRNQLTSDYPALTPTVVTMALQSVYYDEKRARQVLANMMESDKKTQEALASSTQHVPRYLLSCCFCHEVENF